jgi:hypothetical protein
VRERDKVPALQEDHAAPGAVSEARIGVELLPRLLVERVDVDDGIGLLPGVHQVLDEEAERRPPVAEVVLPDDAVTLGLEHTREGVTEDGAPEVADVHLLGDLRG